MKVISIRQPWASLIVKGYKQYEFRTWKTRYRGEIFIHASKTIEKENLERFKHLNLDYETGKIIGKANLTDCIQVTKTFEDKLIEQNECVYGASKGRSGYAFHLEQIEELKKPIQLKGQLGIFEFEHIIDDKK